LWDTYDNREWDPRRRTRFLGDDELNYDVARGVVVKKEDEEPPPFERELFMGEDITDEEFRNDTDDYLGPLPYEAEKAKAPNMEDQLRVIPPDVDEEEALRLAIIVSRQQETNEWQGLAMQLLKSTLAEQGTPQRWSAPAPPPHSLAPPPPAPVPQPPPRLLWGQ
jgi:hypothetical protein